MNKIQNPIIRGFSPDPSIVRKGEDYYIATSTFEWWPGVQIHHSKDLNHWRLIGHALTRPSQLDLRGIADSAGVWAPSMSYHNGKFWLIYTNLRTAGMGRPFKDIGIFLITADEVTGPWSEPIVLNSIGFDPSLFHDDDGRKWLVNMEWDFRKGHARFAGIVVQEYSDEQRSLVGPMTKILNKPNILTEGPNLYKHDGWYYLMLAEGGTGWNHGISMARSRSLLGPYELDPQASVLTSRDDPSLELQKAGHGEIVETPDGDWYLVHLASRPVKVSAGQNSGSLDKTSAATAHVGDRCMLGRETCIQKAEWSTDGWLRLSGGGWHPRVEVPVTLAEHPWPDVSERDNFNSATLNANWNSLRRPVDRSWLSLAERPGWVRLRGGDSLTSLFYQSLIAQRLPTTRCIVETCIDFAPDHFTQMAGLVCYYDTRQHYYFRLTHHEHRGKVLGIVVMDDGSYDEITECEISISDWPRAYLRVRFDGESLQFSASSDGDNWTNTGPTLDASKLSDDYGSTLRFTGGFVGICAQDLGGTLKFADFDYFDIGVEKQ